MKKTRVWPFMISAVSLMFAFGVLLYSAVTSAGLFSSMVTSDWETRSSVQYKLETYGYDSRVYEFDSKDGSMHCVVMYSGGEQGGMDMECIKK